MSEGNKSEDDLMGRLTELVNLGERLRILETEGADKDAKIQMLLDSLKEKDKQIGSYLTNLQGNGQTIADMDRTINDLRAKAGALEDRLQDGQHTAEKMLRIKDERIKELEEALRNKISGPKEQADQLNAEIRERLDRVRKEADEHWALVLYAWSNLGSTIPHKMKKTEDFRKLVDDSKAEIITLRGQRDELNLALQEWRDYREQTVQYAWTQIGFLSMPEAIMKAVLHGHLVNGNLAPTVDEFRGMVDSLRLYILGLNEGSPISRTCALVNDIVRSIERKKHEEMKSKFTWSKEHAQATLPEDAYTTDGGPWNYCQFIGDPPKEYSSWDSFMRAKEKKNVQIKAIGDWKQDLSDAMKLRDLEEQVRILAKFITENIAGEPSCSEGAIDCAIRLLKGLDGNGKESLRCYKRELEKLTSFLSRNFIGELNNRNFDFEGIVDCAIRLLKEHINTRISLSGLKMLMKEAYLKAKIEE